MMYTVIKANEDQVKTIINIIDEGKIVHISYTYDQEDSVGFVGVDLRFRKSLFNYQYYSIAWQTTDGDYPHSLELTKDSSNIRYDIHNIDRFEGLYEFCKEIGLEEHKKFMKGFYI